MSATKLAELIADLRCTGDPEKIADATADAFSVVAEMLGQRRDVPDVGNGYQWPCRDCGEALTVNTEFVRDELGERTNRIWVECDGCCVRSPDVGLDSAAKAWLHRLSGRTS